MDLFALAALPAGLSLIVASQQPTPPDLAQRPFDAPGPSFQWGDFDGDARVDVALVSASGELRLLRNQGDGGFVDATEQAGLEGVTAGHFVLWEDYDADGRDDLFVGTRAGRSRLFKNSGGLLEDVAETAGIRHVGDDRSARWIDYDGDGRLDLHVETAAGDVLYHALASGSFEEVALDLPAVGAVSPGLA
jgi:hypothetical protein